MPRDIGPVHWSNLKAMQTSPAHFLTSLESPPRTTASMRFGTLVHALVLGGAYTVFDGERRGKKWDAFKEDHPGVHPDEIHTAVELGRARKAAAAIRMHPAAARRLDGARFEVPAQWESAGIRCATSGIDVINTGTIGELKLTTRHGLSRFKSHALTMGYIGQLAFYDDAARSLGVTPLNHIIIAAEMTEPYDVVVHRLTPAAIDQGKRTVRLLLEQLRGCLETDQWPGRCASEVVLDVDDDAPDLIFGDDEAA